ncbi:phage antirepressor KilAC domain-containing protein [Paenibacillus apiarius]|uniref:phage antirepressor KilAC domain-containing protein n=1 Tax=Paenibacillus apiarius TaxID=46240 RepID=UPI003B3B05A8
MDNHSMVLFEGKEISFLLPDDVSFNFKGDFLIKAKDVADVLEYRGGSATSEVLKFCKDNHIYHVKNSDMANRHIRKLHNTGEKFISNLSLNRVLGQSGQPKAEKFQDWLYEDMLPSVQRHGIYATDNVISQIISDPKFGIQLLTNLQQEREARKRAEEEKRVHQQTIEEQKPLVTFAEICLQSNDSIKVGSLAHSLTSHGIKIGQNKLYEKLREWKLICRGTTEPTQRAVEQGLFEVVTGVKQKPSGEPFTWRTPYVTVKGQIYVADRLKRAAAGI